MKTFRITSNKEDFLQRTNHLLTEVGHTHKDIQEERYDAEG